MLITLLDDDPIIIEVLKDYLERSGHEVISFTTINDAINNIEKQASKIDLLISDICLPDGNGINLLETLKQKNSDIDVVLMTGYPGSIRASDAILKGARSYLRKPIKLEELSILISQIINHRQNLGIIKDLTKKLEKEIIKREELYKDSLFIKKIYSRLFPTNFSWLKRTRVQIKYLPISSSAGGDYLDIRPYGENKALIFVADVSGHGTPAAFGCIALKTYLSSLKSGLMPDQILYEAETALSEILPEEFYVTAFCGIYDESNRTLIYSIAGHPAPFIISPINKGRMLKEKGCALKIGLNTSRTNYKTVLDEQEVLIIYTDGLIQDEKILFNALKSITNSDTSLIKLFKDIKMLMTTILDTAVEVSPAHAFSDDIAILALSPAYPVNYIPLSSNENLEEDVILFDNVSREWMDFVVSSSPYVLELLVKYLQALENQPEIPHNILEDVIYCIREIVGNAMEWGNLYMPDFKVRISTVVLEDRIMIKVADEGPGFNVRNVFSENPEEIQINREKLGKRDGGYGIAIVRAKMDSVKFNDKGNVVIMTKKFIQSLEDKL
ncbi:MAG: SpoIIE family protein phosphatase [Desulfobacterales bacterium]|nr:SpoIIE family protein phosphatase [Desulfobacterales bacterium]